MQTTIKKHLILLSLLSTFFLLPISCTEDEKPLHFSLVLLTEPSEVGETEGSGFYEPGSETDIKAINTDGYAFTHWVDDKGQTISTQAEFSFTMPKNDVSLTANFSLSYNLTVTIQPEYSGMVTGAGGHLPGAEINLTAIPNTNFSFDKWTDEEGNEISSEPAFLFTMPEGDVSLTAHFAELHPTHLLTLKSRPFSGGTTDGEGRFSTGQEISLSATANEGYTFEKWVNQEGNTLSTDEQFIFIMPSQDATLMAIFRGMEGIVEDIDGNIYSTIRVGNQEWMSENLRVTSYINYDTITKNRLRSWPEDGSYYIYDHHFIEGLNSEQEVINAYGLLYNGFAIADKRGLCPVGWRVPTTEDWAILEQYTCNEWENPNCSTSFPSSGTNHGWNGINEGQVLKSCRQQNHPDADCATDLHPRWHSSNDSYGTDEFGMNLLPGGMAIPLNNYIEYSSLGESGFFLTQTYHWSIWHRAFHYTENRIGTFGEYKHQAFSVRCVKE